MIRADKNAAIGVALSSGGASSLAQVGALEVLLEAGIRIQCVAGTSAGSIVGAALAAGRIREFRDAVCEITRRRIFGLFNLIWPRRGLLELHSGLEFLREFVPETIDALAIPFAAVAADLVSGEEVVIRSGSVLDAMRASCSIPGLFSPCRRDGRWLVDGALVDPLPVNVVRDLGASFVIAINALALDATQVDDCANVDRMQAAFRLRGRMTSRLRWNPAGRERNANQRLDSAYDDPRLFKVIEQASRIVQSKIAATRLREEPADFLLNVPVGDIGSFDFHHAAALVERGRGAAKRALPALDRALERAPSTGRRIRDWWRTKGRREPIAPPGVVTAPAG
jgi:NTE family protein